MQDSALVFNLCRKHWRRDVFGCQRGQEHIAYNNERSVSFQLFTAPLKKTHTSVDYGDGGQRGQIDGAVAKNVPIKAQADVVMVWSGSLETREALRHSDEGLPAAIK